MKVPTIYDVAKTSGDYGTAGIHWPATRNAKNSRLAGAGNAFDGENQRQFTTPPALLKANASKTGIYIVDSTIKERQPERAGAMSFQSTFLVLF